MLKKIFALLIVIVTLNSCTITEEVVVSENGEFEYVEKIDASQLAAIMNSTSLEEKIKYNQISNTEYSYYDFIKVIEELGGERTKSNFKNLSLYKDELSTIDFVKLRLDLRDKFTIEIINRTKSVDEFNTKSKIIEETFADIKVKEEQRVADELSEKKRKRKKTKDNNYLLFTDNPMSMLTSSTYYYNGTNFTKTIDVEKFSKDLNSKDNVDEEVKQLMAGMLKQIKFKYKYTFPKKIKSIDIPEAMFSTDGKSFVKEYSLDEILNTPTSGNFKVELED